MITYRKAIPADSNSLADIHIQAFDGFFLTTLGKNFLKIYYLSCLKNTNTIAICACNDSGDLVGFVSGSFVSLGYHKRIVLTNFFRFSLALAGVLFTKPGAILRLLSNLDKNKNVQDKGDYSEILSFAVLPAYKGKGIGKELLIEVEKEVTRQHGKKITLTTDYCENQNVIEVYKKSGYQIFYEFTAYPNRKMVKMIKALSR